MAFTGVLDLAVGVACLMLLGGEAGAEQIF